MISDDTIYLDDDWLIVTRARAPLVSFLSAIFTFWTDEQTNQKDIQSHIFVQKLRKISGFLIFGGNEKVRVCKFQTEGICVCVREREREKECVCVRERESERKRER